MSAADCRILIFTRDRSRLLAMPLESFAFQNCPFPITIADGSADKGHAQRNAELAERYSDVLDITYKRYPEDQDLAARLIAAMESFSEPMVMPIGDDDFYVVSTLEKAVAKMNADPNLAVCHGYAFLLSEKDDDFRARSYLRCALSSDDPTERLRRHLTNYASTFYALHRRESLIRQFQLAMPLIDPAAAWEVTTSALSVIDGKVACVPELFQVRLLHIEQMHKVQQFTHFMFVDEMPEQLRRSRDILATQLHEKTGGDMEVTRKLVETGLRKWLTSTDHQTFSKELDLRQDSYVRALFEEGSFEREDNLPFLENMFECYKIFLNEDG